NLQLHDRRFKVQDRAARFFTLCCLHNTANTHSKTLAKPISPSPNMSDFKTYLAERAQYIDTLLDRLLPEPQVHPASLHQAMRHSMLAGGKRLRPVLCL